MTWTDRLTLFSTFDFSSIALLIVCWLWIGWRIEHPSPQKLSVARLMEDFRRDWMHQMVTRNPRMFDAQVLGNMRQGTAFFASASMIAIGGGLALIGNTEQLAGIAFTLTSDSSPAFVWEVKLLLLILFLSNAFLKFVWAHRLFGYATILMAAVPNDPEADLAYPRASQAAELSNTAARSFNRAMRATYFALATAAWLVGPLALAGAALLTLAVLYRREFASQSRTFLLQIPSSTAR